MDQMLQVKRIPAFKKGVKYWPIQITDNAFHTSPKSPTLSAGKKIQEASDANKPGRIYGPLDPLALVNPRAYTLKLLGENPDFANFVKEKEAEGYKVVLIMPEGGPPTGLGKDAQEFVQSKKWKRITRALAKRKVQD